MSSTASNLLVAAAAVFYVCSYSFAFPARPALGYVPPQEFEDQLAQEAAA